ncbi:MAG: cytochrome P450 [Proteobacteria bacterium]|nr:cytochrome P450 [Pseudomonadota bacterium]
MRKAPPVRSIASLPGPAGLPVLGNALQIKVHKLHRQLEQWAEEFGPLFKIKLGRYPTLVVSDHAVVAQLLRERPEGFKRSNRMEEIGAEMGLKPGVFGASGDDWKRQRRMVMASFDPAHIRDYFPSLQITAERLGRRWQAAARQARDIDVQSDLMRFTVDTIAGLAFGAEVNTLESEGDVIQQHLDKIFPSLFKRLVSPLPLWRWFPSTADKRLVRSVAEVNQAVNGFVAQARARMQADASLRTRPRNLLEAMIAAADEPGSGISDEQVAGNVMTMLLAGEDTTANTIAWMIDLLWRNPDALARATNEVRQLLGQADALPTFEQADQLDYLEACAHETMRLKPVAPMIGLQALHDTEIGEVRVPRGVVVLALMRRDSVSDKHLPQAARFMPERWLDGTVVAGQPKRISMPFGAGPRICPGRYLALLEMKMAMAMLLNRFDIRSVDTPDGRPADENLSFTMAPVGLRMKLGERAA